jgi:DNA-directed RNA polymerase subunit H (RpoH/RPB5)
MDYELSYDILAHSMGSRYQVMTREETIDFFENADDGSSPNSVSESQIARIDMNGAICRYLGLYPGQLLRVERETVVPGTMLPYEITYRLVCSIPKIKKNRRRGLKDKNQAMAAGKVIS